jgi:hypothetical protein
MQADLGLAPPDDRDGCLLPGPQLARTFFTVWTSTPRLRQSFIEPLPHTASPAAIHHRKAVNIGLLGDGGPRRGWSEREQCTGSTRTVLSRKRVGPFSQAARPNDNAASQSYWCCAGLDADQSSARPRGSCFCWHAELKINDRTSASPRPQDVTNIRGIRAQSRGAA